MDNCRRLIVIGMFMLAGILCGVNQAEAVFQLELVPNVNDASYITEENGTSRGGDQVRVDWGGVLIYKFDLSEYLLQAELRLDMDNEFKVSTSSDGSNYTTELNSGAVGCESIRRIHMVDLTPYLAASPTSNVIYVKIEDAVPTSGCGVNMRRLVIRDKETIKMPLEFSPNDGTEGFYLYQDNWSGSTGGSWRAADWGGSWIYRFDFPPDSTTGEAELTIANNYKVSVSSDGVSYTTKLNVADNCNGVYNTESINLTPYLSNANTVYIKFENSAGFAGCGANLTRLKIRDQIAFQPDSLNGDESNYLFLDAGSYAGAPDIYNGFRAADWGGYWIYRFELPGVDRTEIQFYIANNYLVSASGDGVEYIEELNAGTQNCTGAGILETIDLSPYLVDSNQVFLKFENSAGFAGCGANLGWPGLTLRGFPVISSLPFGFHVGDRTGAEDTYVYLAVNNDAQRGAFSGWPGYRAADWGGYWVYRFDLAENIKSAQMALLLQNNSMVSISSDNSQYTVELEKFACDGVYREETIDISPYLADSSTVYLKFENSAGFAGCGANLTHLQILPLPDADGDGVPDKYDVCPDTPEGEIVNIDGCSLVQALAECDCEDARNHGEYVSCVSTIVTEFEALDPTLNGGAIVSEAAKSNCGKPLTANPKNDGAGGHGNGK